MAGHINRGADLAGHFLYQNFEVAFLKISFGTLTSYVIVTFLGLQEYNNENLFKDAVCLFLLGSPRPILNCWMIRIHPVNFLIFVEKTWCYISIRKTIHPAAQRKPVIFEMITRPMKKQILSF